MNIELNEQQTSYVLQTLAQRPIAEAFEVFQLIQRQAQQQMQQAAGQARLQPVLHDNDRAINGDRAINARQ
jgi:hypothetical protein